MAHFYLKDKIALITGSSDLRGIGFACAKAMAERGATVVLSDIERRQADLELAVKELTSSGYRAKGFVLDVTREERAIEVAQAVKEQLGPIGILVNNAGIGIGAAPLMKTTTKDWTLSWQVNVLGCVNCCRAVIPHMLENGGGVIINNSSMAGLRAMPAYGAYAAHKHAVIGLTKTLAAELGRRNIRVVAICPGVIDTAMNDLQIEKLARDKGAGKDQIKAGFSKSIALNRIGDPEEVGNVAAFLAGDEASYMTGNAVEISGGIMAGGI